MPNCLGNGEATDGRVMEQQHQIGAKFKERDRFSARKRRVELRANMDFARSNNNEVKEVLENMLQKTA